MATDEIRLSTYGETIEIQQGLNGRVVLQVQTDDGHAAPVLTPAECDALIAAIGRALGRPAPASTPPLGSVAEAYNTSLPAGLCVLDAKLDELLRRTAAHGEQGATVPRAGVEALRARLDAHPLLRLNIHSSTYARDASLELDSIRSQVDALLGVTEAEAREAKERTQRATLEAAGLWPVAAPGGER